MLYLLVKISEPDSKEVHLLCEAGALLTGWAAHQPLTSPVLLAAPVEPHCTAGALHPVLGDRKGAEVAGGAWGRGEQGEGAVLLAVGHKLVMLIQATFGYTTVQMKSTKTLLKIIQIQL